MSPQRIGPGVRYLAVVFTGLSRPVASPQRDGEVIACPRVRRPARSPTRVVCRHNTQGLADAAFGEPFDRRSQRKPRVHGGLPNREGRQRKGRVGEGADGDAVVVRKARGLPVNVRTALRAEMEMDFVAAVCAAGEDLTDAADVDLRAAEIGTGMKDGAGAALARPAAADIDPLRLAADGGLQGATMTAGDAFHGPLHHFSAGWRRWRSGEMLLLRPRVAAWRFQQPSAFPIPGAAEAPPSAQSPLPPNRPYGMRRLPPRFPRDRCRRANPHRVLFRNIYGSIRGPPRRAGPAR